jgi:hypothetical protein
MDIHADPAGERPRLLLPHQTIGERIEADTVVEDRARDRVGKE